MIKANAESKNAIAKVTIKMIAVLYLAKHELL